MRLQEFRLVDLMDDFGVNELWCSCGVQLHPDCDISSVSINECFIDHYVQAHSLGGGEVTE